MISKMHLAPGQQVQGEKRTYLGGPDGLVADIDTADVTTLLRAGATYTVMPKTLSLMVAPHQVLSYGDGPQKADEHGIIPDVPFNTAIPMITDPAHPARVATDEELARAGYRRLGSEIEAAGHLVEMDADEIAFRRAAAAKGDAILAALSARFGGAEIIDTGAVTGPHEDMIFAVQRDGAEIARGTVTDLFAHAAPTGEAPVALTTPETDGPHDGDVLPETAPAATSASAAPTAPAAKPSKTSK